MKKQFSLLCGLALTMLQWPVLAQINRVSDDQMALQESIQKNVEARISQSYQTVKSAFDVAYIANPDVPRGLLEAVSFNYTRFTHRSFVKDTDDAGIGMPRTYGVMGLTLDGQRYFRDNLNKVSALSGISASRIIANPADNVMAYAKAFQLIARQRNISSKAPQDYIPVLIELCELPLNEDLQNDYAMNTFLYGIFDFLKQDGYAARFGFPNYTIDLKKVFGSNYNVLSSSFVKIEQGSIETKDYQLYKKSVMNKVKEAKSTDYGPAIWNAAASCNYTVGRTKAISAVAVHYTAGSYAGSISWFQNCAAVASAHYCLRSSDGQITQMVREADKAWHVRDENPYTIGFEHEAIEPVQNYFTVAMYQSSAALLRDICASGYGISPLRMFYRDTLDDGTVLDYGLHSLGGETSCVKIKGHQHFPNNTHTDPGPYWNWEYYFKQVNNATETTTYNTPTGTFTDDGGASANYTVDNRKLYLIDVPGASQITLSFTQFALEANYDFMYIYDGNSVYSPRIGRFNTISPGTVTSTGSQLLIEFRSDCATPAAGWVANWTSVAPDAVAPTSSINQVDSMWVIAGYTANFTDADNAGGSGIDRRFYQVMYGDGQEWTANQNRGFAVDNFDMFNTSKWKIPSGNVSWSVSGSALQVLDTNTDNSNIYSALNGTLSDSYMYDFYAKVDGSSTNKRFGFHFACDSATLTNRGNSYFIYLRPSSNQLEFYRVANNTFTLSSTVTNVVTNLNQYYHYKIVHNRISGKIEVFRDDIFLGSWTDPTPLTTPSKYFSFRTARTQMWVKNMRVYRTRAASVAVSVGVGDTDIPIQSKNSNIMSKVKSMVVDNNNNYSSLMSKEMRVDWTKPVNGTVIDGSSGDLDVFGTVGIIRGSWTTAIDTNSGIQRYKYAIGTSLGATNVVGWTDNGLAVSFEKNGLTLIDGTTYYIMVKSQNGAGLWSDSTSSDGAVFHMQPIADFNVNTQQICTGGSVVFSNLSANITGQTWYFTGGSPASSTQFSPTVSYASAGTYAVKLVVTGATGADSVLRSGYIIVQATPSLPSIVSNPTICQGSGTQLEVSGSATLIWYSSNTGGTALGTGTTLNTGILNGNTSFYVRSEIGSCLSPMATVNVLVEPMPAAPVLSNPTPICSGSSTQLTATGTNTIKWYSDQQANNLVASGAIIQTPALSETTTYFVRSETAHCITPMNSVTVQVNPIPAIPTVNAQQTLCQGQTATLNAQGEATLTWYGSPTATSALASGESYQTSPIMATDTFYVRSEVNGCNSGFAPIVVVANTLPAQPTITLNSGQLCTGAANGYLWFFNGVAIDTAVNQCYRPLQNGNYTVQVVNAFGCLSPLSSAYSYSTIDIAETDQNNSFSISPNPTKGTVLISLAENTNPQQLKLYNALGQVILQQTIPATQTSMLLDLSGFSKGLYYLQIDGDNGMVVRKIFRE